MPYNIWCDGCKNHIGMGVRYNAEKKKVGNYYTTPIYRFRMKCHLCVNYIEMQTDPATCDYVIVSGARRKEERWDMADNEQILTTERTEKEKLETDAMYKLDHGGKDKEKLKAAIPSLSELQEHQAGWKDDFQLNSSLRRKFREEKKVIAEEEEKDNAVRKRTGLSIALLPEKEEDKKLASLLTFQSPVSYDDRQQNKRKEIASRSWFSSPSAPPGGAAGSLLHKLSLQGKGAAAAKALGAASPGSLSLIRRKTEGNKPEACATVTRRKSDPGLCATSEEGVVQENTETSHGTELSLIQPNKEGQETEEYPNTNGQSTGDENRETATENCGTEEDRANEHGTLKSLVADYSDSDSDPGQ
ncbi:putative splicing factor YJU2B [Chanos chanos]|uniref:Probable splicing factor YJU2B n=1 Tax=Chanos chanos TaxID=29144 RepID=A0A6J2W2R5_CHACN|nr:coiled-coil domain-containing protein 130 [Chanos chanos]